MPIFLLALATILIIICVVMGFLALADIYDFFAIKIPFVSTRKRALESIVQELEIQPGDVFCDLGSGNGNILRAVRKHNPDVPCFGFELGLIPYFLSVVLSWRDRNITTRRESLFNAPFAKMTKIYCYLGNETMRILEPILVKECRPGTMLISCDFPFPTKKPLRTVSIAHAGDPLSKTLYVYRF